jgi:hypothetical protein
MTSFRRNSLTDILSEIRRIFQEISKETSIAVYDERTTRLEWMTEHKGEYYHTQKRNPVPFEMSKPPPGHELLDPYTEEDMSDGSMKGMRIFGGDSDSNRDESIELFCLGWMRTIGIGGRDIRRHGLLTGIN